MEKSRRLNFRDELANKVLKPILDSLHPILVLSIMFFITGLLFQLWMISLAVDNSSTLILASTLGSLLILSAAIVTVATALHGGYCEESPFTMSTSASLRSLIPKRFMQSFNEECEGKEYLPLLCTAIKQMDNRDIYDHASSVRLFGFQWWSEDLKPNPSTISNANDAVVHFLGSDASKKAKLTMTWNLLDLENLAEADYERLQDAVWSLEVDTPLNQEQVRLGFTFVRIVLLLRSKGVVNPIVSTGDSYLGKAVTRSVFLKLLTLPECIREKSDAASELAKCAQEDCHYFDGVRSDLFTAILTDDNDLYLSWRESILRILPANDISEILSRLCSRAEKSAFHFLILQHVRKACDRLIFPVDFDLSDFIPFARSHEHVRMLYTFKDPTEVLLSYFSLMDDTLLSRQRDLRTFVENVLYGTHLEDSDFVSRERHMKAQAILDRLAVPHRQ